MKRLYIILVLILTGCNIFDDLYLSPCITGKCEINIVANYTKDINGFYHIPLSNEYSYFNIYAEASGVLDNFKYNGIPVIEGYFDSNAYWVVGDSLSFVVPLYNAFSSLKTNPYWNSTTLPIENKTIYLSQFEGFLVPIVQESRTYFQEYQEPNKTSGYISDYKPTDPNKYVWTKRIIGPIPKRMKGDTITIYAKAFWEAGENSLERKTSTKLILE